MPDRSSTAQIYSSMIFLVDTDSSRQTMLNSGSVATFTKDLKILSNITTIPGPSEGVIVRTEWFFRMWPVLLIQ